MIKSLLAATLLVCTAAAAMAQQSFEFSGDDRVPGEGSTGRGANVDFLWRAEVLIGTLVGEPVVSTRFAYDLDGGMITLPSSTARGKPAFETHLLSSLPQEAIATVRLYDLKLRVDFEGISNDFFIETDVGLPGPSGEWSFNVPSSPDWDTLFQYSRSIEGNRHYLPADAAKREYLGGLEPSGAYIVSSHVTLWDLHEWYEDQHPLKTLDAYGAAINQLEEGLHLSYGYPRSVLDSRAITAMYAGTVKEQLALIERHKERIEKLLDVPDLYKIGDNHGPYDVAAEQARKIRMAILSYDQRIESGSDQEILLEITRQGRAPRFDDLGIDPPAEAASKPRPQAAAPPSAEHMTIPLDACVVVLFKECQRPYSETQQRVMIVDYLVSDFPSDICSNGSQIANYLPATEWFFLSQGFPQKYAKQAETALKTFPAELKHAHPACIDQGSVFGLSVLPAGIQEGTRTCARDVTSLGSGANIQLCANF